MKIDKRNPIHWFLLIAFFLQALFALLLRRWNRRTPETIVMYGHKLNGNLLALYEQAQLEHVRGCRPIFLTMDRAYSLELHRAGFQSVWAASPGCAQLLGGAAAVISDHGLHSMQPLLNAFQRAGLRFVDVWHGIPFKGFDAQDFQLQHRYDEIWVASELCRDLYVERFGFPADRVVTTGYARTDRLMHPESNRAETCQLLGLPASGPLLLFAPTWKQDAADRSLYPFNCQEREFLAALGALMARHGGSIVLRSHLNSGEVGDKAPENVYALPSSRFPDTEAILLVSDILLCDWSSIAFDFLLLDRPAIFLDVPPPFLKGLSIGPDARYGMVARSLDELLAQLSSCLAAEDQYWRKFRSKHEQVRNRIYGSYGDGNSSQRCFSRLQALIAPAKSSAGGAKPSALR